MRPQCNETLKIRRTGSLEKTGPSGTRFTRKELFFCHKSSQSEVLGAITDAAHAEKEPLEVLGHGEEFLEDGGKGFGDQMRWLKQLYSWPLVNKTKQQALTLT